MRLRRGRCESSRRTGRCGAMKAPIPPAASRPPAWRRRGRIDGGLYLPLLPRPAAGSMRGGRGRMAAPGIGYGDYSDFRKLTRIRPCRWKQRHGRILDALAQASLIHGDRDEGRHKNSRISCTRSSSRLISRLAASLDCSSAASYWFRYLRRDLTPILQPSVIRSAMV